MLNASDGALLGEQLAAAKEGRFPGGLNRRNAQTTAWRSAACVQRRPLPPARWALPPRHLHPYASPPRYSGTGIQQ